ncbi:hypothetical protein EVAR_41046_1 [Eumeta japonica]|uniref:Uncharacterized protein n=1 Tax=Eumeta variegata TaxID=151549 RepID=A0A4C1XQV9_EUMVA|nr:hypothetical protein EVAR_41046_1 [Eumeta japonica]
MWHRNRDWKKLTSRTGKGPERQRDGDADLDYASENGFLAVWWANDGQRFQAIKTSLLQRSFICGGRRTTATDAPISLQFIDGASA